MKDISVHLKKNKNVVFLCRNTDPLEFTSELLKTIDKKSRVLYVSVNKPCSILTELFKKEKIDYSKWFFIDCISSSMLSAEFPSKQCLYLASPSSLVDLAVEINERIESSDLILFDSVSSLLYYNDYVSVLRLLNTLMANIRKSKNKGAYLLSYDVKKEVMEDLALFADELVIL